VQKVPFVSWLYRSAIGAAFHGADVTVTFRGARFVLPTRDITITPSVMTGDYETFELDRFESLVKPGDTILDVGGNVGIWTIIGARRSGPSGRVVTFEPIKSNVDYLARNIELNALANVTVLAKAAGAKAGQIKIYLVDFSSGTHSVGFGGSRYEEVEVVALDDVVRDEHLKVDVVKIDVEGYEAFVLAGAKTLLTSRPHLFLEYAPHMLRSCGSNPDDLVDLIFDIYDVVYVLDERNDRADRLCDRADLKNRPETEFALNLLCTGVPLAGLSSVLSR
jgi:FkbM family methyltransferase